MTTSCQCEKKHKQVMVKLSSLVEQQVLLPFVSLITARADRCAFLADLGSSCLSAPVFFSLGYFRLNSTCMVQRLRTCIYQQHPSGYFFHPQISHIIKIHAPVQFSLFSYFLNLRLSFHSKLAMMGHQPPITHIYF